MDKYNGKNYNMEKGVEVIQMETVLKRNTVPVKSSIQTLPKKKKTSAKELRKIIATPSAFGVNDVELFKQGK